MEFSYQEDSKSSSEEIDRSSEPNDEMMGTGRSYECVFCKRGFTSAQALGGHMNIHRKDRANNKAKPNFPPSSSTKVDENFNYVSSNYLPSYVTRGNYYSSTLNPDREVDTTNYNYYHQLYFPSHSSSSSPSHVQYSEVLCAENQRDPQILFGQDWRQRGLSLYTNPSCVHENKDKIEHNTEEDDLDLELRLGHYP